MRNPRKPSPALLAILDRATDPTARLLDAAIAAVDAITVLAAGEVTDDDIDEIDVLATAAEEALDELRHRLLPRWSV